MDTKSYYVNSPINSLNYIAVGWSWNLSQIPYLYWGGDNTDSGAECVMFNIESMIDLEDKMPDIMKMNLCANWFGSLSRGHVTVECTAYKGGVIVHAWQLKNNAPNSASAADATTKRRIEHSRGNSPFKRMCCPPTGSHLRKKSPQAMLRDFGYDRYDASEWMFMTISVAQNWTVASG